MGRWGDWETGRWGDGEMGRLGDGTYNRILGSLVKMINSPEDSWLL